MSTVTLGVVSAPFDRDLEGDFARIAALIEQARGQGVHLLALPEAALGGYLSDLRGSAPPPPAFRVDGPEIARLAALAGDMVVCAGYCEEGEDGKVYNSVVCVDGSGVLGNHRKVHQPLREDAHYTAGSGFRAFDTPVGRIGMVICYDKAFPESARALALDGAQIVVCVSAWPGSRTNAPERIEDDRWKQRFDLFDAARAWRTRSSGSRPTRAAASAHCGSWPVRRSSAPVGTCCQAPESARGWR